VHQLTATEQQINDLVVEEYFWDAPVMVVNSEPVIPAMFV